jgi:hypothetical protein
LKSPDRRRTANDPVEPTSVDRPQATAVNRSTRGVLALELLVDREEIHLEGEVVATLTGPVGEHAHGVRDGLTPIQGVQVVATATTIDEIEEVVIVADAKPAERRPSPPLLVAEADLVGEPRLAELTWDDQVHDQLPNLLVPAQIPNGGPAKSIEPGVQAVATLVESVGG